MAVLLAMLMLIALGGLALALWLLSRAADRQRRAKRDLVRRADPYARGELGGGSAADHGQTAGDNPLTAFVHLRLLRSGVEIEARSVNLALLVFAGLVLVTYLLAGALLGTVLTAAVLVALYLVVARKASARRRALLDQLPAYLEHVLRALSAGNTLEESIAEAARESSEPVAGLFTGVARQVRLGASVESVLARQAEIYKLRDLAALAMATSVNRQYGGSLRRVIKSLIAAIRSRDAAGRELRALTAESRVSAWVLISITIGLTAYVLFQNPDYYAEMWADWSTRALLLVSVGLQATGILVIYRMVRAHELPDA